MSSKNKKSKLADPQSDSDSASALASDSDNSNPPRNTKEKQKKAKESKAQSSSSDSTPPRNDAKAKSNKGNDTKGSSASSNRVVGETEPTWDIGGRKFITIREFKGKTYIHVREYYEKDGKTLPGKGASMNIEQWQTLCSSIDEVNKVLNK